MKKNILSFLLSVNIILALYIFMKPSILIMMVFFFVSFLLIRAFFFYGKDTREIVLFSIFSFLFSFFQVIGYQCTVFDSAKLNAWQTYYFILSFFPFCYAILGLLQKAFEKLAKNNSDKMGRYSTILFQKKYSILLLMAVLVLLWLPVIYAFFPGNFSYDAGTQVRMVHFNLLSQYHPVIHTMLLGGFMEFTYHLFQTFTLGLGFYTIFQVLFMAFTFSYLTLYLKKRGISTHICLFVFLLFLLLPTHVMLAVTTTKDVIFSGLIAITMAKLLDLTENPTLFFQKKRQILLLGTLFFLLIAFRNNVIYAFLVFIPFFFVFFRKYYLRMILLLVITFGMFFGYSFTLNQVLHIPKGPRIEMFSVIIQQIGRVYHYGKTTDSEKEQIELLFPQDVLKNYNSHIADPLKSSFQSDILLSKKSEYFHLYFTLLKNNPSLFLDSFLNGIYSYFYFYDPLPDYGARTYIEISCFGTDLHRTKECYYPLPKVASFYTNLVENADYQKVPILNLFMNMTTYIFMMFFTLLIILWKKRYDHFIPIFFLILLFLTNLLGPVSIMRYAYPMFVSFPIFLFIILNCFSNKKRTSF